MFEKAQVEMALICKANGWHMNDGYDEEGKRYLIIDPPEVPTLEQQKAKIKGTLLKAVDHHLDKTVQARGYDNIAKCVTYEGDIDPIFNKEGTAAKQWRSKVYRACYNILAEVEGGQREVPTAEELIAELPKIEW